MKKTLVCSILAVSSAVAGVACGQEGLGGFLNGQVPGAKEGGQPTNSGGFLQGVVREQIQNAIQPAPQGGQNVPGINPSQGPTRINGQVVVPPSQFGNQPSLNTGTPQLVPNNQTGTGATLGSQLLGVLQANLNSHIGVGQDGTIRFRNDINPQIQGMGILPNDQLVDVNGQPIRDLNSANSYLQGNQQLRVLRNGQIVTLYQPSNQSVSSANQLGWSFGTRNNGVYVSSLVTNGLAAQAGIRVGDQIVSVNGNSVGRVEDIAAYLSRSGNGPTSIVYIRNGQASEAYLNSSTTNQFSGTRPIPQSIQSKLDQIERLIGEIRSELSLAK